MDNQSISIDKALLGCCPNKITAALLVELNGYINQKATEQICNLSGSEIYRRQQLGTFPSKIHIGKGQRKAYRIHDIKAWLANPTGYYVQDKV